jgi:hypothetical protein
MCHLMLSICSKYFLVMWTGGYTYLKKLGKRKQRNLLERLTKVVAVLIHEKTQNSLIRDSDLTPDSQLARRRVIRISEIDGITIADLKNNLAAELMAMKIYGLVRRRRSMWPRPSLQDGSAHQSQRPLLRLGLHPGRALPRHRGPQYSLSPATQKVRLARTPSDFLSFLQGRDRARRDGARLRGHQGSIRTGQGRRAGSARSRGEAASIFANSSRSKRSTRSISRAAIISRPTKGQINIIRSSD